MPGEPCTSCKCLCSVRLVNVEDGVSVALLCSSQCSDACTAGQLPPGGGSTVGHYMDGSPPQCNQHSALPRGSGHRNRYICTCWHGAQVLQVYLCLLDEAQDHHCRLFLIVPTETLTSSYVKLLDFSRCLWSMTILQLYDLA